MLIFWLNKLKYLIEHFEIWEEMGKVGRKHIENEYEMLSQVEKLEKIYTDLIQKC